MQALNSQAIANNTMQGANALAAGQVGSANAWSGAANNLGSMAAAYAIMNKMGVIWLLGACNVFTQLDINIYAIKSS